MVVEPTSGDHTTISWLDIVAKSTALILPISAIFFFAGLVYTSFRYAQFQIDPSILDFPVFIYTSLGVVQIVRIWMWILAGILIVLMVESFGAARWEKYWRRTVRLLLLFASPVIIFFLILWSAKTEGTADGRKIAMDSPHVHLSFKPSERLDEDIQEANNGRNLRILAQTKDLVVVFEPAGDANAKPNVFFLERADLASVHIWK